MLSIRRVFVAIVFLTLYLFVFQSSLRITEHFRVPAKAPPQEYEALTETNMLTSDTAHEPMTCVRPASGLIQDISKALMNNIGATGELTISVI